MLSIAGELITERLEYDGGRQVTVYVPPTPAKAVVFAGDGQLIPQWSESLAAADVPPMPRTARRAGAGRLITAALTTPRRPPSTGAVE